MGKGWFAAALAAWVVLASASAAWAQTLSPQGFRDAYAAEVRRQAPSAKVQVVGPEDLEIVFGKDDSTTAYTGNAYREYAGEPEKLQAIVTRYVGILIEAHNDQPIRREDLRLVIRPYDYIVQMRGLGAKSGRTGPDEDPLHRPFAGDLYAMVARDTPTAIGVPPLSNLRDDLKMDDAAIWDLALANTKRGFPRRLDPPRAGKLEVFSTPDGYGPSLLLDDRLWDELEARARGPLLVAPVGKNTLAVVLDDGRSLPLLRQIVAEYLESAPDRLVDTILTRRGGKWVALPE